MQPVNLNGADVWGYVVESDEGVRVRFGIDDWQQLQIGEGQLITARIGGKDARLFVANVRVEPPVVWVTMARRIRAAG
ncbi:hypothetical protein VT84_06355 [Gemmata sp. SH-PL17]|uniref:hypothetical protein n=1 Tax=Gemmata sp. SH-PL17 TaxID=1630693 RepID=UPI00078DA109|nr:hypothetical protein [Gemmata sp. SH-PL17]AMV23998.1 hypothetical protein VT84_06355 [Gemmata sp. SH-PL17]